MSKFEHSESITGLGWDPNVIAAVAIIGILLTGSLLGVRGTLVGLLIGFLIIQTLSSLMSVAQIVQCW